MNGDLSYNLIEECSTSYRFTENDDGTGELVIKIDRRFVSLWLHKLNALETNDAEIAEYEPEDD